MNCPASAGCSESVHKHCSSSERWGDAVSRDRIANMLLAVKSRGGSDFGDRVAQNLARETAREQLQPLFATACSRLAAVLHRAFDIASELQALSPGMH